MEPEDRELRSALQRLASPAPEAPAVGTVVKGGETLRLRHHLAKAGITALVVALVAGGVAGVWLLTRELPARTTDQAPVVTEPAPGTPDVYEQLTALPAFSLEDMKEIDVSGPGAAFEALTPEANPDAVAGILSAYAEATLSPPADGGYTFPEKEPDVTMAFVPKSGEPLYVGMHLETSSVSLEVWTAGRASGTARRAWISGDALHSHFRTYFGLASQYSLTHLPALSREDLYLAAAGRPGWDRKLLPAQDAAEIDAIFTAYNDAIMLPPPAETYHPPEGPPVMELTLTFGNQSPVIIRLYREGLSDVMEVWDGASIASGTSSRARIGGDALFGLLGHYVELADEQSGAAQGAATESTTTESAPVLPAAPPVAELEHVAVLLKEAGIQNPAVTSRVISLDANPIRCYALTWTVAGEQGSLVTPDLAQRALAIAKAKGDLSLDYYRIELAQDGGMQLSKCEQIPSYDAALWSTDPASTLERSRSSLLPEIETLAADHHLTPVDASVDVDQAAQVLSVQVTMARDGDTQDLTKFVDNTWKLVYVLNRLDQGGPGRVGVGYLRVVDPEGATLVFLINDFMTGTESGTAEITYPDRP